jgi:membrane protein
MIDQVSTQRGSILATLLGGLALAFGATGVFIQLQDALNTIWKVAPNPDKGLVHTVRSRILSLAMIVVIGFLLLISLVISAALQALHTYFSTLLPGLDLLWQLVNVVVSIIVISFLFAAVFKILPDAKIKWSDVWVGALATALLFSIGKYLIGLYLGQSSAASLYGAAGSLVLILLWVYYSSLIVFFGAEFTQIYARRSGSNIQPDTDAVVLDERARLNQGIPRREQVETAAVRQDRKDRPVPEHGGD